MFDVIFLGTSASSPSAHRGLSAHIVIHRQYRFLVDCGEGTQRQILRSEVGFKKLNKILLTHAHLDHILGLAGLVSSLARWDAMEALEIYGGKATLSRVRDLLQRVVLRGNETAVEIQLIPIQDGDVLVEDDKFSVTAFEVAHRGPDCLGFLFEEKERRPFLAEEATALGVPFGPERSSLVRGEAIYLADGRLITPDMVLGESLGGTKYVHIADVGETRGLEEICRHAHALTIEATYTEAEAEMARQFGHLTAARAAQLAKSADVQHLILTHISRRHTEREIRSEAQGIFPAVSVARDFDHFTIRRGGGIERRNLRETGWGRDDEA